MREAQRFFAGVRGTRTLIVPHSQADVDALCASLALADYFPDAVVCVPDSANSSAKLVAEKLGGAYRKFRDVPPAELAARETLILVDANSRVLFGGMAEFISEFRGRTALVDHHALHLDAVVTGTSFRDESASSACEVVYELFRALNHIITPRVAELLTCGIVSDTSDLRNASTRTIEVMAYLLKRSPLRLAQVFDLTEGEQDANKRISVLKTIGRATVSRAGDFIFARAQAASFEGVAANQLVSLGADYAFVAQVTRAELRISARCRSSLVPEIGADVGEIMARVGEHIGGSGGGHPGAAGANGPATGNVEEALLLAENIARDQVKKSCMRGGGAECDSPKRQPGSK